MRRQLLLVLLLLVIGGCASGARKPEAGDTWQLAAEDLSGTFGAITVERGAIIPLPPGTDADIFVPGATRGILVHISYEPQRPSDVGYGSLDWESRGTSPGEPRIMGLVRGVDWGVDGTLPTQLPGSANSIGGWMVIPVTEADLGQPITLLYQPIIVDEPAPVAEIVVHAP